MKTDDTCPEWPYKTPIEIARWIDSNFIVKITHHWRFTSEDTSENWIELHAEKGAGRRIHIDGDEVTFRPDHATLVHIERGMSERINQIDAWKQRHARELVEYRRLSAKFAGRPVE